MPAPVDDRRLGRGLARTRRETILGDLRRQGSVRVAELVERLGVSDMTVRRDLEVLADAGLLTKVHGGATASYQHSTDEPGFEVKSLQHRAEKTAIARAAALHVSPGASVGISAGSTTAQLAVELVNIPDLTVVTNSVRIGDVFAASPRTDRTAIQLGGVRTPSDALVGPIADAALAPLHLDIVFIGVHGMDPRAGFTTPNLLEAGTNQALVRAARQVIVVADHSKWGVTGLTTIAPLDVADVLVTDDKLDDDAIDILREHIRDVVVTTPTDHKERSG